MKLNKKVFAGALALAMGLSAIAPVYADGTNVQVQQGTSQAKKPEYEQKKQAFIEQVQIASKLKKSLEEKEKLAAETNKKYKDLVEKNKEDTAIIALYESLKKYDESLTNPEQKDIAKRNLENLKTNIKRELGESELVNKYIELVDKYVETKQGKDEIERLHNESANKPEIVEVNKIGEEYDKLIDQIDAEKDYTEKDPYLCAREGFLDAGGSENEALAIEKSEGNISVPENTLPQAPAGDAEEEKKDQQSQPQQKPQAKAEDTKSEKKDTQSPQGSTPDTHSKENTKPSTKENKKTTDKTTTSTTTTTKTKIDKNQDKLDKQIEEAVKKLKRKLEVLNFIKENLKETYKRNAKIIDTAIEAAQKALKLVEKK